MFTIDDVKETVLGLLADTPLGRQMQRERHDALQAERAITVRAIAERRKRSERDRPALRAAEVVALEGVRKNEKDLAVARERWFEKYRARRQADASADYEISRLESDLVQSSDPAIDRFLDDLRAIEQVTRNTAVDAADIEEYTFSGARRVVGQRTNIDSISRRMAAVRSAIATAAALKLAVQSDLAVAFVKILASIPAVEPLARVKPEPAAGPE